MQKDEDFEKIHGQEARAVSEADDADFLGRLFWYTVAETMAPADEYEQFVRNNDITEDLIPNRIKKKNAWRRATKDMEKKETIEREDEDDLIVEYMTRKLDKDTRHLVKEVRLPDEGRLDYEELIEWTYDTENDYVSWKPLVDEDDKRFKDVAELHAEMSERMKVYQESFTDREIRRMARNTLERRNKISLKSSGGVYFVPEEQAEFLRNFKKLLEQISEWGTSNYNSELWQVPVISNSEQRDMIEQGIREETISFANKKIRKIKEILEENEEITQGKYNRLFKEVKKVQQRKQKYADIIDRNLEVCDDQLDVLKGQIDKLADNVKQDDDELKSASLNDFKEE